VRGGPALDRGILFFGGKGGVGKTTLAAAAAVRSADGGAATLLVSTDPAHSAGDVLQARLGGEPRVVHGALWAMELDPEGEVERYIDEVRQRVAEVTPPRLVGEVERQIEIARVSPGAEEAAVFDRFTRILHEERRFGRIIFDTAPTGQTLRLLTLPESMEVWISGLIDRRRKLSAVGRMWRRVAGAAAGSAPALADPILSALEERRSRFASARSALKDPRRTSFLFVITPEHLPIQETRRALSALARHGISIGGLFVNRVAPGDAGAGTGRGPVEDQDTWLAEIDRHFEEWPIVRLPLADHAPLGLESLRAFSSLLTPSSAGAVE